MATAAFQSNAFQHNAFQTGAAGACTQAFQLNLVQDNAFQTCVTQQTTGQTVGSSMSGGYFSRKRWHEIISAQKAAQKAAELTRSKKKKAALERAAEAARIASAALERAEIERFAELRREADHLITTLESASSVVRVADALRKAKLAETHARNISVLVAEIEDEEEAVALLLVN